MQPLEIEEGFVDISEDKDCGLLKKILVEGTSEDCPPSGSHVDVHYAGTLHSDGSKFDSSRDRPGTFKFDVGVGQVIKGWDVGICTMKKGEKAILRARHDYAYGENGSPPKIPENATLNFEVELFGWKEKVKPAYQMTAEERKAFAQKMKDQGTEALKAKDFATAVDRYSEGIEYITHRGGGGGHGGGHGHSHGGEACHNSHGDDSEEEDEDMGDEEGGEPAALGDEEKQLAVALLNNCAMARLKAGEPEDAMKDCAKCLNYDPSNIKALFRWAQAQQATGNFQGCVNYAQRVLDLEPENKEAAQLRVKALNDEKLAKKKEKAMYGKMFG